MPPLVKTPLSLTFGKGLDTKTDRNQLALGNFVTLENTVFSKGNLLQKRNGFNKLPALPDLTSKYVTTHNTNLVTLGNTLQTFSDDTNKWSTKGLFQDTTLEVDPLVRNTSSQLTCDSAIAPNGAVCTTYLDADGNSYYATSDAQTGEIIVAAKALEAGAVFARVACLGSWFIVTYILPGTPNRLKYINIPIYSPEITNGPSTLAVDVKNSTAGYDITIYNDALFYAYWSNAGTNSIRVGELSRTLIPSVLSSIASAQGNLISICVDSTQGDIWVTYWQASDTSAYAAKFNYTASGMSPAVQTPTLILATQPVNHITAAAYGGICYNFYQITHTYSYNSTRTDFITTNTITNTLVVSSPTTFLRSVGLGSKAFVITGEIFVIVNYGGAFQPTYFLADINGDIITKIAYANGIQYALNYVLPQGNVASASVSFAYLFKDLLAPVNKQVNPSSVSGIYTQTGINLGKITLNAGNINTSEIGGGLHVTGGIPWLYDGSLPVEDSFFVWPEDIAATSTPAGSGLAIGTYNYQVTYEWTDANGNIQRSAPSVPLSVVLGATSTVTINIPTLRLTYKEAPNDVRIVIYRWSVAQQIFYQITSIPNPIHNDTTVDSISYVDSQTDAQIIGNLILYTTGGVIENIQAPASVASTLYKSRMFIIYAEDRNTLGYSKQVIPNTAVDMSDLFTIFVPPTTGAQGSTGPMTALSVLDDKLIIFKENAIYYMVGVGPDNTGAQNDFSDVVFITSTVGCPNPQSIVFSPQGLMFQSDKGIWLLGRDLSTNYIGAAVEAYNPDTVVSALNIPGTNQVRFVLNSGITLMYDYYFNQWGTFTGVANISSTLYLGRHTFINDFGEVFQESTNSFVDGGRPVNMNFKTGWIRLSGVQNYQRLYFIYMLANFISPHTLHFGVSYDFNESIVQDITIEPDNWTGYYGDDPLYGDQSNYGGEQEGNVEQWRLFPNNQRCQSFQLTMQEYYDPPMSAPAGAGFTLSELLLIIGEKKGMPVLNPSKSVG